MQADTGMPAIIRLKLRELLTMRRNRRFASFTAAIALTAISALAQPMPQGVQKVTSVEGITEYSLPNGLRVLLFPDNSKPKVTVNMTYLVGSRFEGYGETGMAHLLEHMLFKKTKDGRDVKKELADHGADFNGTTSYDRTNYFETVTASDENLKWALGLEADRMTGMRIEKELLDTEMTVVRNEFEMGENNPGRILEQRVLESAYTFHAYGRSTIGSRSDIEHVPIEKLAAFYQKYYQPDNAILTVAGKFDEPKTLAWITQMFTAIPRPTRKLDRTYTEEPVQDGERTVTLRRVGDTQEIMVVYHGPAGSHPDCAVLDVLAAVLGEAPSGRLYKALVDNHKAVGVGMEFNEMHDPGYMMAAVQLKTDQNINEARDTLLKIIENVAAEPPSKEEVERAKARIMKQIELGLTDSESVGLTLSEVAADGDWRLLFLERDQLAKVTPEDVLRVAKAYLKSSNRTLGEFIPTKTPDRAEIPPTPDIAALFKDYKGGAAISQGEEFDPSPTNIEKRLTRFQLSNGTKVVLLPKKTRGGTVVAQMVFRFGDEKNLFGKGAVAQMTGAMLMRGTKTKSRQQIQDETDKLKVQMNVSGGVNSASAGMETTEANLAGALNLAAEVLKTPSFPEGELEKIRQQRIAGIEAQRSEPQSLAFLELSRHLSVAQRGDLRYVPLPDEQIEDLKKVTIADARQFYQQFYGGGKDAEIAIVGQFDPAQVKQQLETLFGNWKTPAPYARVLNPYRKIDPMDKSIETPDKKNAVFAAGVLTKMSDDDTDFPAMIMADYMLGGPTSSRLFTRIREKEGLSYAVQTVLNVPTQDDRSELLGIAIANPENTPKAEASFKDELARTLKDGFTAEEVAAAKTAWLQEHQASRAQDHGLAGLLMSNERWGRTLKYDQDLESKISALTPQQIIEALRRHLDLANVNYVKAGDFKKANVYQR
jgi:zinc protease